MLRRQRQIRVRVHKLIDAGLFCLAFWLAHQLRAVWKFEFFWERPEIQPFREYAWMIAIIAPISPPFLAMQGFYARPLLAARRQTIWQLFWACAWTTIVVVLISFLAREQPARGVIVLFGAISFVLVLLKEEMIQHWVQSKFGQDHLKRRLLMVGAAEDTGPLHAKLKAQSHESIEILAEINLNDTPVERLVELLHDHSANGVILSAKHTMFGQVERVIQACELEGVEVWLLADFFKTQISQTAFDDFEGRPMLVFRSTPEASWQSLAKQAIDVVGACFLLFLSSPLLLGVALLFVMMKFRSMMTDAEQRKHELEVLNEMTGPVFKLSNDPRITPVGRFIRKYSIDEFPQLMNVVRGEMSLVGPRPLPVDEVRRFDDLAHRRRLSVKPGLTCLWQVSGRSDVHDFTDWVRLDLEYIDNWSLWLDLKILCRTIPVVLLGTGAK